MKKSFFLILGIFFMTSMGYAQNGSGDLNQWNREFNQAMGELETVENVPLQQTPSPSPSLDVLRHTDQQVLDSREDSDAKARMVRMESKIAELEREQKYMSDRIRNLDRQVNDLKRKV